MSDFAGATQYAGSHGYMPQCVATRRRDDDATRPNARAIEDELLILKF
jgi:hypothetical protein